ncbi:MAG: hypothetical protein EZS28_025986, partial [Streblomastix strix]
MIRANMGLDQVTGVHNDRILPDLQGQPQRNSFSYNSQTLSVQGNTENKQGLQGDTSNGIGGGNYRDNNQRTGKMLEPNFHSTETGRRMEKDIGRNTFEQRDPTFTLLNAGSGERQNDNLTTGLVDQTRPEVSFPPSDSLRTTQTLSSIRSGGSVLQVQGNALWDPTLADILYRSNESNPNGGEKDMGSANNQLFGRYSPTTPGLIDLETTNNPFDGNIRTVWSNNLAQEMRAGTEIGDSVLRLDLEFSNNGTVHAGRSKVDELRFTQEIGKDNFGQSYDQSQISGSNNWNFKFSQNTVQGGFPLSDAPIYSTNMSSERTRMVRDDEITDASTARDVLVDQQDIRKQETFFDMEHSSRDSSYGCSPPGLGSDSGTENGRSSSGVGPLEERGDAMDQQSQGNGGHFLRSSVFRNTLRTIGNEGNSDKIGQLFDSIQSQKTEGSTTTSIWSQESIQNNSTFGSIGIDSTCSGSDQLHSRFSEQIGQLGGLQYKPTTLVNPIYVVEPRANSGSIRKPIQCDSTSLCINRPEGLKCAVDRSIQPYMGERNPLDPPTYPNDTLDFNDTQTVMNYSDCGGTLVARPTLVHNTVTRKLKMDYPWTIEPNPDSGSEYDSETSPPPTRQDSSLPHGYIADRGHQLLTRFLDAVG